ncbi:hypothetical protein G7K_1966-t1 [Saitoella complicata NRRL Y-17804]|uniref:Uncharacterized protein n=1 Tax=Saitoella complicata (strain BCRC 22490 / CBS 7301 / JCM 7358 / NBRC 10748 / NRRL Y-17804) TaxID=698492 RepID=A0A0E9ND36_SAICN|nr:hypothetical protein G7K_1966-t1 [Saitoella complicata NRRL Y-17804]
MLLTGSFDKKLAIAFSWVSILLLTFTNSSTTYRTVQTPSTFSMIMPLLLNPIEDPIRSISSERCTESPTHPISHHPTSRDHHSR